MNVLINDIPYALPEPASVADAIAAIDAALPYAVAVNRTFVPRSSYGAHALKDQDRIEIIRPVTGG